ncbi:MAG: hypothetical protein K8T20_03705 [Planctomycetes bacterium]|nr:hypothetical protein [Planctomycetota bacterium]
MRLPCVILSLVAALGVFAEEPADAVRALSAQLADDDAGKRDAAEAALLKLGAPARPAIEAARDAEKDPEAKARLVRVLESFDKPLWLASLAEGTKAAEVLGRPLMVIFDPVPERWANPLATDPRASESSGRKLKNAIDENVPVRSWLSGHFATAYLSAEPDIPVLEFPQAEGTGGAIVLFISPKLGVRHLLRGWWSAERFRKEGERALEFLAADETKLADVRAVARKEIAKELAANPHPPIGGRHSPEACSEVACILPRLLQCYDTGDTVLGKTGDEALKILHGER